MSKEDVRRSSDRLGEYEAKEPKLSGNERNAVVSGVMFGILTLLSGEEIVFCDRSER
jgi:hypothetical protein